jgi:hypothetical protein
MAARCILCDRTPTTRAHLYGRTLRNEFPGSGGQINHVHTRGDPHVSVLNSHGFGMPIIQQVVNALCAECNGVWMQRLEAAALPGLTAMIRGQRMEVDADLQAAVAEWAVSVTMLRTQLVPDLRPFDRGLARRIRSSGLDGEEVGVWLFSADADGRFRMAPDAASSMMQDAGGAVTGELAIYWFRSVVLVVATQGFVSYVEEQVSLIAPAMQRLWPASPSRTWPFSHSVLDSVLTRAIGLPDEELPDAFSDRTELDGRQIRLFIR